MGLIHGQEVIDLGAAQLVVPGNFPIGCAPSYLTMFTTANAAAYDADNCLENFNSFAVYHNDHLQAALEGLRRAHPRVTIMYADYYEAFMYLLNHAADLGEWPPAMDHRWISRSTYCRILIMELVSLARV